ncbi:hypothetical protein [Polymorphospora sp. NPDC050346]|uniref:hypothetical protein n=1 Tax=Polymorphospora sp. NPDC050346 TaxID=3155780 RepID=UPI0033F39B08
MPRGDNQASNSRKRAARTLATSEGIPYTAALRRLGGQPTPPIPVEALAAADVDPAAGYAADDWSYQARSARQAANALRYWEQRRAGRPVRLWQAEIEVRCAATGEDEAWWRIALGYMRYPLHRVAGVQTHTVSLSDDADQTHDVAPVPDTDVDPAERRRLEADYPRRPMPWPVRPAPYGPEKSFDITDYAAALRRGAARAAGRTPTDLPDPAPLPAGTRLGIWRAVHQAEFLAGHDIADARRRAAELAATIVDTDGRPLGRVVDLKPDDGFRSATSGEWIHPACWPSTDPAQELWDDHDAAGQPAASLARILADEADRLARSWAQSEAEHHALEARLHTQPDGTRTLSAPAELERAALAARFRHGGKTPAELRAEADHYDYMADRVYGKAVHDDDDIKRVEEAAAMAKTLRQLADERDARAGRH